MKRFLLFLPVLLVVALRDAPAARPPSPQPLPTPPAWRCAVDRADATSGIQRLEWATRCGLIPGAAQQGVAAPSPIPPPTYPIFESVAVAGGGTELIPLPTLPNSGCALFAKNRATGDFLRWPGAVYLVGYCTVVP